jgi:hypothetical protein
MDSQKLRIMATNITRSRYFLDSGKVIDNVSLVVLGAHQPKEIAYGQRSNAVINKQITLFLMTGMVYPLLLWILK